MDYKNNKGSITLYVVVAMLAFVLFSVATYTLISRRNQTQIGLTSGIKDIYGDLSAEEKYASYFAGEVVPIYTAEDFKYIGTGKKVSINKEDGKVYTFSYNATYILKNDIDLNAGKYSYVEDTYNFYSNAESWNPIVGDETLGFTGLLEGNGYTISGFYIKRNDENTDGIGLFKKINGGIINNVKIKGEIDAPSCSNVGVIAGKATGNYKIRNSTCDVKITAKDDVGGFIGSINNSEGKGDIDTCTNLGIIEGETRVGGIVGFTYSDIVSCTNHAKITGITQVGGIVGNSNGKILRCKNDNEILASNTEANLAGGIAGINAKNIENSFNTGKVEGYIAGGIAGQNSYVIQNCYNTGRIIGASYDGGITGKHIDTTETDDRKIKFNYNIGVVVDSAKSGGIIGAVEREDVIVSDLLNTDISNNYYLELIGSTKGGINKQDTVGTVIHSVDYMKTKYFLSDLGASYKATTDFPVLEWQKVNNEATNDVEFTQIMTPIALVDFAYLINTKREDFTGKTVTVGANIDMNGITVSPIGIYGDTDTYFKGTFEGAQWQIRNLSIIGNNDFESLFTVCDGGIIRNLKITDATITCTNSNSLTHGGASAIVGELKNSGSVQNCSVTGTITGDSYVAGICSLLTSGSITGCSNNASISGNTKIGRNCWRNKWNCFKMF